MMFDYLNPDKRVRQFSWEKSDREHLSVFEEVYRANLGV